MRKRQPYEKPTIVRHAVGTMNKFGQMPGLSAQGMIDGVSAIELVQRYGSPLFVVSEGSLRRKYREMYRAFSLRYPKVVIAYSYKTNYLGGICKILHQEGAWAEVVSGFEYDIAHQLGVPGNQIVFNGPHKTKDDLLRAIQKGSIINVDSYDEIYLLEQISRELNLTLEIGVRVNMEAAYPNWDRFGFHLESGQACEACKRILSSGRLQVVGLHVHLGTYIDDVNAYATMADKLVGLCAHLQSELGIKLKYLDVGGGYASKNTLHVRYLPGEQTCPTFDQYAEAVCPILLRGPFKADEMPLLILEPGRSIVDEAVYLLCSVIATKRLSNGQKGVVVDAGVNLLPTSYWYRHDIVPAQPASGLSEEVNLYGPLCMFIDCLRLSVSLPPLRRGDVLIIKNVGAYNFSQSMQFIQPRPAVVLVNEGNVFMLRRPETTEYIRQLEELPEHLKE